MFSGSFMKTSAIVIALGAALGAFSALSVQAQEKQQGSNSAPVTKAKPSPVSQLQLAHDLYEYGKQAKDAVAVITAAKIALEVQTEEKKREVETKAIEADNDPGQAKDDAKPQGQPAAKSSSAAADPVDAAAMLKSARELAGDDKVLIAMIDEIGATQTKGRRRGPGRFAGNLDARSSIRFVDVFRAGETADVWVRGDGDTDVDLYVYDENGNLICRNETYGDQPLCRFWPRWTGPFTIRVVNRGYVFNRIYLYTN